MRRTSNTRLAGVCAALLALATAGCASQLSARNHQPPKLRIGLVTGADGAAPAMAAAIAEAGYVLGGALPDQPTHAQVWRWDGDHRPSHDDVVRLAAAVGIVAQPQRHAHGWVVASASGELRVSDRGGGQWAYVRGDLLACPPYMIDVDGNPDSAVGCAMGVPSSAPVRPGVTQPTTAEPPPASGPDEASTRAAAHDLLASLHLGGAERVMRGFPDYSTLIVSPTIGSLPTAGLDTQVDVDGRGIRAAHGLVLLPEGGDDYPLRTAKAAFDDLQNQPRPMIGGYCPADPAPSSCPPPEPTRITGGTLGLQLRLDAGEPVLVPAWFFTVDGSAEPIPVVAVDPAYIDDGATSGGGRGQAGVGGGTVTSSPIAVPPVPPSAAPVPSAVPASPSAAPVP